MRIENFPQSSRKIGLLTSIFLVATVMIGNGIYTSLGIQLLSISSGFGILALWLLGGLVALCAALSYAELASCLPHSGGDYYYFTQLYHPAVGTMAGIVTLLAGFVAPTALAGMAFGKYLQDFFPACSPLYSSMVLVTVITMAHLFHFNVSVWLQNILTTLKFTLITVILVFGFYRAPMASALLLPSKAALHELLAPASGVALLFCFYSYSGWNAAIYMADEIISSRKNVGRSLVLGTLFVMVIYLLLNAVFLLAAPAHELRGALDIGAIVATHLFGVAGGRLMAALIAMGLMASVSGMIWIGPRITQAMGRDLFALRWLASLSSNAVPVRATLIQYVLIMMLLATASFKAVLVATQVPITLCSLLGVFGLLLLRRRRSKNPIFEEAAKSGFRCPWYPLPPLCFALLSLVALGYTIITNLLEASAGLLLMLGSLACYPLLGKKKIGMK